jgi:hypothetical protein
LYVPRRELERKLKGKSQNSFGTTYILDGSVALEGAIIDLHISTRLSINSSALEVACGPPGHGRNIRKFLETITPPLTHLAVLASKAESWMARIPNQM